MDGMSEQEKRAEWRREFIERWWTQRPLWAYPDVGDMVKKAEKHANEGDE